MLNQLLRLDSDVQFGTQLCGPRRCGNEGETLGEFVKEVRLTAQARTNGHGVIHRLKTFFARASVRTQLSHGTVNW
jgi:hypothetical protein